METIGFSKIKVNQNWNITPKTENFAHLQKILHTDPLKRDFFTDQDKNVLMICRNHYKALTSALQIFLYAIDWSDPE
jgi:phosphatidylinositol-4,5-bisphosphate 3-kinase